MPSWNLACANCHRMFQHSEIEDTLINSYWPKKPDFPTDGSEIQCPHCGRQELYQQHQLFYQR